MSSKNPDIKAAIDSMDVDGARSLLRDALKEADAETYYLASQVALSDDQKRDFLKKAVDLDPFHAKATEALQGKPAAPVASYPLANTAQPKPTSQTTIALESAIERTKLAIKQKEERIAQLRQQKTGAAVGGVIGLFLVVALIGLIIIIAAVVMYSNADKEEKVLDAERAKLQQELLDLNQQLREAQAAGR